MTTNNSAQAVVAGERLILNQCPLCQNREVTRLGVKGGFEIVACQGCGLRYVKGMPSESELEKFYSTTYGTDKDKRNMGRKVRRWFLKLLPAKLLAGGDLFLDLGCNTGFAVEAARLLGFKATGFDLSERAIGLAKIRFTKCEFHHGTFREAVLANRQYDVVVCAEMIEHLTELDTLADALTKVVRVGGILYLTTPDLGDSHQSDQFLSRNEVCPPEHLIYFSRAQIKRFLQKAGFEVVLFVPVLGKQSIRVLARRIS